MIMGTFYNKVSFDARGELGIGNGECLDQRHGIEPIAKIVLLCCCESNKKDSRVSYRDLKVWKLGVELAEMVYKLTNCFPKEERYGLISQVRRAAIAVPSNISEGYGRFTRNYYKQFVRILSGSLYSSFPNQEFHNFLCV